ncbi:glycine cleavage system protein GcvH [Rhodococcus marinonascens]|uniref:glycine cleavage system protein GcvH n=1 Tax=Rhodococcus marinonascens TaxID=38311 RepID=UPI0009352F36|nr:glycine cleavage system protein GcvH [Rhodococcus marinonascens]
MSELEIPGDRRYTPEHEWVERTGPNTVRVGITDFAQSQLGDVVFVQLPAIAEEVTAGDALGEVESTKSVSDIFSPLTAKVVAANVDLDDNPEFVNSSPYAQGWLVDLEVEDEATLDSALAEMLDAVSYADIAAG